MLPERRGTWGKAQPVGARMRRLISVLLAVVVVGALVAPAQGSAKARTARSRYSTPNGVAVWVLGLDTVFGWDEDLGRHSFRVKRGERRVIISIEDAYSEVAQGYVRINNEGARGGIYFCGRTPEPIAVAPGDEVNVLVLAGVCPGGTPAMATMGVVEATFGR